MWVISIVALILDRIIGHRAFRWAMVLVLSGLIFRELDGGRIAREIQAVAVATNRWDTGYRTALLDLRAVLDEHMDRVLPLILALVVFAITSVRRFDFRLLKTKIKGLRP